MMRIIKKYPNRRLYDTDQSCYITIDTIKEMVLLHVDFKIIDAKTDEDLTNNILLQIISEQESQTTPLFTSEVLKNLIRFYGQASQDIVSQLLEQGIELIVKQQHELQQHMQNVFTELPLDKMTALTQQNISLWQKSMQQLWKNMQQFKQASPAKPKPQSKKSRR